MLGCVGVSSAWAMGWVCFLVGCLEVYEQQAPPPHPTPPHPTPPHSKPICTVCKSNGEAIKWSGICRLYTASRQPKHKPLTWPLRAQRFKTYGHARKHTLHFGFVVRCMSSERIPDSVPTRRSGPERATHSVSPRGGAGCFIFC
jgi:hypothetical protein